MAFYNQHARQQSWDQSQAPPSQSSMGDDRWSGRNSTPSLDPGAPGTNSPSAQRDDSPAFASQYEEIERAHENLTKSGRAFGMHNRRESIPSAAPFARQYPEFGGSQSMSTRKEKDKLISTKDRNVGPARHMPPHDFEGHRSHSSHSSSNYQGYIANQRFGPRMNEAEQVMQYKRRAAAQRERELRNYHQEQQFNRNQSGPKSDRSMSPSGMNEDDRRELIARQHRALYGDTANIYGSEGTSSRPLSQDARVLATNSSGGLGDSPVGYESFTSQGSAPEGAGSSLQANVGHGQRSRENSMTSKSPGPNTFAMFDGGQQANRTSSSSPGVSPTRQGSSGPGGGVAPIGTRPNQGAGQAKRNTPPMPSPLGPGYSFGGDKQSSSTPVDHATSSPANPSSGAPEKPGSMAWGSSSGPWGSSKNQLGAQTSVWG